jgi:hypothetical protein
VLRSGTINRGKMQNGKVAKRANTSAAQRPVDVHRAHFASPGRPARKERHDRRASAEGGSHGLLGIPAGPPRC